MNLREGTRRLALLLGAVGAVFGGFASYMELQTVLAQRQRHNKFEQLARSDGAVQERNCMLGMLNRGCTERSSLPYPNSKRISLPNGEVRDYPIDMTDEQIGKLLNKEFPPKTKASDVQSTQGPWQQYAGGKQGQSADKPWEEAAKEYRARHSDFIGGEIKTITWTKTYMIESIETQDGQTLYPTPAPSAWLYLLIALLPVLGFFIPWGAIRAIGWVGTGFIGT